jgi:prophage regulatory protein
MTAPLPITGFIRLPVVLQHIPVARSTWWAGVRDGRFPPPVKIGGVTTWRVEDIRDLIEGLHRTSAPSEPRTRSGIGEASLKFRTHHE